jgi:hypothetical protein
MPDASGRSLLTKTSSPPGKTPPPASPLLKEAKAEVREVAAAWSAPSDHRSRYLQSRNS